MQQFVTEQQRTNSPPSSCPRKRLPGCWLLLALSQMLLINHKSGSAKRKADGLSVWSRKMWRDSDTLEKTNTYETEAGESP